MTKQGPFFSVIVNTYNSAKTVEKTLNSVFAQTFTNYEIIVVDDHSTDDTVSIIKKVITGYNKKVKVIKLEENQGIAKSRNIGIDQSEGEYIAFLDGDDLWKKNKLMIQYNELKKNSFTTDWVFSNYDVIDNGYNYLGERKRNSGVYGFKAIVKRGNPVGMLTVVIKSKVLKKNKFRNVKHEDYDLWIRLSKRGHFGILLEDSLAMYMKHSNSVSSNKLKSVVWTFNVFRLNNINFFTALYLTGNYILNYFTRKRKSAF